MNAWARPTGGLGVFIGVNSDAVIDGEVVPVKLAESDAETVRGSFVADGVGSLLPSRAELLVGQGATLQAVSAAVLRAAKAADADDDWLVVFFSGHAHLIDGEVYLGLADFDASTIHESPNHALSLADLRNKLLPRKSPTLLLLDCCHSGAIAGELHRVQLGINHFAIFAAPLGMAALELTSSGGAFAGEIRAALAGEAGSVTRDGEVTPETLFAHLRDACPGHVGSAGSLAGRARWILSTPIRHAIEVFSEARAKEIRTVATRLSDFGPPRDELSKFEHLYDDLIDAVDAPINACLDGSIHLTDTARLLLQTLSSLAGAAEAHLVSVVDGSLLPKVSLGGGADSLHAKFGRHNEPLTGLIFSGRVFQRRQHGFFVEDADGSTYSLIVPLNDPLPSGSGRRRGESLVLLSGIPSTSRCLTEQFAAVAAALFACIYDRSVRRSPAIEALDALRQTAPTAPNWMFRRRCELLTQELGGCHTYFQPIVDVQGEPIITGWEALLRTSDGAKVPRIALTAEQWGTRLAAMLDAIVLDKAMTSFVQQLRTTPAGRAHQLSVNCHAASLIDPDFQKKLRELDARFASEFNMARLCLEISERTTLPANDDDSVAAYAERLLELQNALGIKFAIDDFGTESSNLRRLDQLSFANLKLDRSTLHADFARDVITFARRIAKPNTTVIVEGWDQDCLLSINDLCQLRVDGVQGFGIRQAEPTLRELSPEERMRVARLRVA